MKTLKFLLLLIGATLLGGSLQAITISAGDGYLIGTHASAGSPASESALLQEIVTFANSAVPLPAPLGWTYSPGSVVAAAIPNLPSPVLISGDADKTQIDAVSTEADVTGYDYAMIKSGTTSAFFYLDGLSGVHTIINDGIIQNSSNKDKKISHLTFFRTNDHSVSDSGATLLLLGGALVCFALLRKRF